MDIVQVNLPRSVVERAQEITGERKPGAAITALVQREGEFKARFKRGLRQSLKEERARRGTVFGSAREAVKYLKSL